ncbi:hypothetical protein Leryth_004591 [Lithospermum erythrorhizon]|nr:hypothetical protein Leryth_004591 [Lithospermum erythrorhizon]
MRRSVMVKIRGQSPSQHNEAEFPHSHLTRVQFVLNKGLTAWENYCLQHCFSLPQGFTLPETNEVSVDTLDVDMIGQECAGLSKVQTLDRQAVVSNHSAALINEALELYQNQSANDLFKELRSTSSEFRSKLEKFRNSRAEEMHQKQLHGIYKQNGNAYNMMHTDGAAGQLEGQCRADQRFVVKRRESPAEISSHRIAGVDLDFNSWVSVHNNSSKSPRIDEGCFKHWDLDRLIARKILGVERAPRFPQSIILEGGSIHVDGTCLTTEECLLNKNRSLIEVKGKIEDMPKLILESRRSFGFLLVFKVMMIQMDM